jgi:predicted alpha-1,6-mannanase (GH76 family)
MGERQMRARRAVDRLLRFYRPGAGRFRPATGAAWQLALAIEAVTTMHERTGEARYGAALETWRRRHAGRRSRFFDDDAWYVNAWLRAHDATGDARFLTAARAGFADLLDGWDDVCGGGLWWSRERTYKNAITNSLFLLAAARLRSAWSDRAWAWLEASGMINEDGLVNDGLHECRNNGGPTWTYNQGVLISALVELSLVDRAATLARAAMRALAPGGILREPSEADCDADQEIFKGVLAQGLGRLCRADPAGTGDIAAFLRHNADSVWAGRDASDAFGLSWTPPAGRVTPATHASATLLLAEVAALG